MATTKKAYYKHHERATDADARSSLKTREVAFSTEGNKLIGKTNAGLFLEWCRNWFKDTVSYATFAAALVDIGSGSRELVVSTAINITGNTTIPANVYIRVVKGGSFNISGGVVLTINGPFQAGFYQVFSGSGTVVFGGGVIDQVEASWWGPAEDGVTDAQAALQAAITAAGPVGRFHAKKATYYLASKLNLVSNVDFDFGGATCTVHTPDATTTKWIDGTGLSNVRLSWLNMVEQSTADTGSTNGIWFDEAYNIAIAHCTADGFNESGIRMKNVRGFNITRCRALNSNFRGIHVAGFHGVGTIDGCEVYNNDYHGLYIGDGGTYHFRNCYSHDNNQYGFYMSTTGDGLTSNVTVEECTFVDNVVGGIIPDYHIGNLRIVRNSIRSKYNQDSIIVMRDSPLGWYGGGSVDIIGNTMDGKIQVWNVKQGKIDSNTCLWIEGRGLRNVDIANNNVTMQGVVLNAGGYVEPTEEMFNSVIVYGTVSHSIGQFWGYNQANKRWFLKRLDTLKVVMEAAGYNNLSASDIGKVLYKSDSKYGYILDYDNASRSIYVWMIFAEPAAPDAFTITGGTAGTYTTNHIERLHPEFIATDVLKAFDVNVDGAVLAPTGTISATNHYNDIGIFIVSEDASSQDSYDVVIRNNLITDGARAGIYIATVKGACKIENNRIENVALGVSTVTSYGIEVSGATNPIDRAHVIRDNTSKNVQTGGIRVNTGKWLVHGNVTDSNTPVSVGTGGQAINESIGTNEFSMGSAAPAAGTWNRGDKQFNTNPSAGVGGWNCTAAGTFGTLGAVTGDTTNGSPILTNTSGENLLLVGQYISISTGFAAGPKLILKIDTLAHTITLDSNATSSTVAGVVTWATPTFETFGRKIDQDFTRTSAAPGATNVILCENTDNATGSAKVHVKIGASPSTGNAWTHWELPSVQGWSHGINNSVANDPVEMANAGVLGTNVVYQQFSAANGGRQWKCRVQNSEGASPASAGDLTLGTGGNFFQVTGTTTINGIAQANWVSGAVVTLKFGGALTLTHNGAPSAGFGKLFLSGSVNASITASSLVTFRFDGTNWNEQSRMIR